LNKRSTYNTLIAVA